MVVLLLGRLLRSLCSLIMTLLFVFVIARTKPFRHFDPSVDGEKSFQKKLRHFERSEKSVGIKVGAFIKQIITLTAFAHNDVVTILNF